jgi:ApbE superfamily uncharacterized protein (UPF0280 family)
MNPAGTSAGYRELVWKGARYRVRSERHEVVFEAIKARRREIESYIGRDPEFGRSLVPIELLPDAPEIAGIMARAADAAGVGPMAAVAGAIAESAAREAIAEGAREAIIDNGGDLFLCSPRTVLVGLHAGAGSKLAGLALEVKPALMPLAVCSSSGRMGHSMSLGDCDLATVVAPDGALADAVATATANRVRSREDVEKALQFALGIRGVAGVLVVQDRHVGMAGDLPPLARLADGLRPVVARGEDPASPGQKR